MTSQPEPVDTGGRTPQHTVRVADDLWNNAMRLAQVYGIPLTVIIRSFLQWWTHVPGAELPERPEVAPPSDTPS